MIKCRLREGGDPRSTEEKWGPGLTWQTNPSIPLLDWMRGLVVVPVTSTAHKQTLHSQSGGLAGMIKVLESIPTPHPSLGWDTELLDNSSGGKVTMACKILPKDQPKDPALKWEQPRLCLWSGFVSDPKGTKMTPWFGWMCCGYCKKNSTKIWGWNLGDIRVPSNPFPVNIAGRSEWLQLHRNSDFVPGNRRQVGSRWKRK